LDDTQKKSKEKDDLEKEGRKELYFLWRIAIFYEKKKQRERERERERRERKRECSERRESFATNTETRTTRR
jgi:hypothetical protein